MCELGVGLNGYYSSCRSISIVIDGREGIRTACTYVNIPPSKLEPENSYGLYGNDLTSHLITRENSLRPLRDLPHSHLISLI